MQCLPWLILNKKSHRLNSIFYLYARYHFEISYLFTIYCTMSLFLVSLFLVSVAFCFINSTNGFELRKCFRNFWSTENIFHNFFFILDLFIAASIQKCQSDINDGVCVGNIITHLIQHGDGNDFQKFHINLRPENKICTSWTTEYFYRTFQNRTWLTKTVENWNHFILTIYFLVEIL